MENAESDQDALDETGEVDASTLPYGVKIHVSYDGTDFSGWQRQDGQRTVQGELERAIDQMGFVRSRIRGCSRTDSGVHARAQVASFACEKDIGARGWRLALTGLLPFDVAVFKVESCKNTYDPRFDAKRKHYRYSVCTSENRDPHSRRAAWWVGPGFARRDVPRDQREDRVEDFLDVDAMREAASALVGTHSFHSFRASSDQRKNTEREMHRVEIVPGFGGRASMLAIDVEGNAFMRNMVRIMAGTLVEVGRQRMTPSQVKALLEPGASRKDAGPTAPPEGLCLERIWLGRQG